MTDTQGATRFCANCGSSVEAWAQFCGECGAAQPQPEPASRIAAWEAIVVLVITLITQAVVAFVAVQMIEDKNTVVAVLVLAGELTMLLVVVAWVKGFHGMTMADFGWRSRAPRGDVGVGLGAAALGLALEIPLVLVGQLIGRIILDRPVEQPQQLAFEGDPSTLILVITGIGAVILAPIAEESLFRGIVYKGFRSRLGVGVAALLSGILFGLVHVYPLLWLPIGALGYILALTFERRGSLLPPIVGHALFNAVGYAIFLMSALN